MNAPEHGFLIRLHLGMRLRQFVRQHYRLLLAGLPAVAGLAATALLAQKALSGPDVALVRKYERVGRESLAAGRYATAQVCFDRLIRSVGPRPEYQLLLVSALEGQGQVGQAADLLDELAPADRVGLAPAHMRRAQVLLASAGKDPRNIRAAEAQLRNALSAEPQNVQALTLLAQVYVATGQNDKAEALLGTASRKNPELLFLLARVAQSRRDDGLARRYAADARAAYASKIAGRSKDPQDFSYVALADSILGDHPAAAAALLDGIRVTDAPALRGQLARVYASWSDSLKAGTGDDVAAKRLDLINKGLAQNAAEPMLLNQLGGFTRGGGPEADRAREALVALLANGKAAPWAHLLLGVDASARGDQAEARMHLEQAYKSAPAMPAVSNNLAWVLAVGDPPQLDRALDLVNSALKVQPDNAHFRDTRGRILAKLGRWSEALTDLEAVLGTEPGSQDLHLLIAQAYDHLGAPMLAARHRNLGKPQGKAKQ